MNMIPYTSCKRKQQVVIRHKVGFSGISGLVAYYLFNEGIAGGNNTGVTTADDVTSNHLAGTLTNFALTGSTGNRVEDVSGLGNS
jgi:hypothetical protein